MSAERKSSRKSASNSDVELEKSYHSILGMLLFHFENIENVETDFEAIHDIYIKCASKEFIKTIFRCMAPAFGTKGHISAKLQDLFYGIIEKFEQKSEKGVLSEPVKKTALSLFFKYQCDGRAVFRENMTEFVLKIVKLCPIEELDNFCKDIALTYFLNRLKDKSARVREIAANGLRYFQAKENIPDCVITQQLVFHLRFDPSHQVRIASLKSLKVSETVLEFIIEKARDIHEDVRVAAYDKIGRRVKIDSISLTQRETIVEDGFRKQLHQSDKIKNRAEKLIEKWLEQCKGDILVLLEKFDVFDKKEVCEIILLNYFKVFDTESFSKVDVKLFGEDKLIPIEKLSEENAFYWSYLMKNFMTVECFSKSLIPSVNDLILYIEKFVDGIQDKDDFASQLCILRDLLKILLIVSKNIEEGGRSGLRSLFDTLFNFPSLTPCHLGTLCKLFYIAEDTSSGFDIRFIEFLSSYIHSHQISTVTESSKEKSRRSTTTTTNSRGSGSYAETQAEILKLKALVCELIHRRHKMLNIRDKWVAENNYLKAHEIQAEIDEIKREEEELHKKINELSYLSTSSENGSSGTSSGISSNEESGEGGEEVKSFDPDEFSPMALNYAFFAFHHYLFTFENYKSVPVFEFHRQYVARSMACKDDDIRAMCLRIFAMFGIRDLNEAKYAMNICVQALNLDNIKVQIQAYKTLIDCLLEHGFEGFREGGDVKNEDEKMEVDDDDEKSVSSSIPNEFEAQLKALILSKLSGPDPLLTKIGVSGMIKLHLAGRFYSDAILTKLLLIWSYPCYQHTEIHMDIEAFFCLYVKRQRRNALMVAESLKKVIQKIDKAPESSSLSTVPPSTVIDFVLKAFYEADFGSYKGAYEKLVKDVLGEMSYFTSTHAFVDCGETIFRIPLWEFSSESLKTIKKNLIKLSQCSSSRGFMKKMEEYSKEIDEALKTSLTREKELSLVKLDSSKISNSTIFEKSMEKKEVLSEDEEEGDVTFSEVISPNEDITTSKMTE